MARDLANRVLFKFNKAKAIETVLWFAGQAPGKVDVFKIVKGLFFADLFHLNKYGRPISGDFYVAMENGPVPSQTYNIIKGDLLAVGNSVLPFERRGNIVHGGRTPDLDLVSESDLEAMRVGWDKVKDLDFSALWKLAHDNPAYIKTWDERTTDADIINFSDLIDDPSKIEDIRVIAASMRI